MKATSAEREPPVLSGAKGSAIAAVAIIGHCECGAAKMHGAYECPCCGKSFALEQSGVVMAEADKLEELIQLKLENPGVSRAQALEWAMEMRQRYTPNKVDMTSRTP